jgi:hypothetical protein
MFTSLRSLPERIACKCKNEKLAKLRKANPHISIFINDRGMGMESFNEETNEALYSCPHCKYSQKVKLKLP